MIRTFVSMAVLLGTFTALIGQAAAELAGPHNAANNIGCFNYCHILPEVKSPYWNHSSDDIDDTPTNHLCNSCHDLPSGPYSMTHAPKVLTHSSKAIDNSYGDWTTECTDCHNPHFQEQLQWINSGETDIFVATGSITAYTYNSGTGETTLDFDTAISYKPGWDAAKLTTKTIAYRRTTLIPDTSTLSPDTTDNLSYQVVAVDEGADTITVKGDASEVLDNVTLPASFGIIYGQLLREYVKNNGALKRIRFFDNTAAGSGGFTDQSSTASPYGVCQVCHTQTSHWSPTALAEGDVHFPNQACTDCHFHESGFAHGGVGGTGCESCHGHDPGYEYEPGKPSQGAGTFKSHSAHTENDANDQNGPYVTCDVCHDINKFPFFKSGNDDNGDDQYTLAETNVCDPCHNDATGISSGSLVLKAPPAWNTTSLTCTSCHAIGPVYTNGSPKANSHAKHAAAECETCHSTTISAGASINDQSVHPNGAYTLQPGAGVSFSYTFNTGGGTCSTISCHGNQDATWGATLACDACHAYPPVPGDGKDINGQYDGGKGAHVTSWDPGSYGIGGHIINPASLDPANDIYGDTGTAYNECYKCHKDGTHADGIVDVMIVDGYWSTFTDRGLYERPQGFGFGPPEYQGEPGNMATPKTCSNIVCHQGDTPRWSCPGGE